MVSGMTRQTKLQRAEDKIGRLSGQGLDMVAFWRACAPVLADAVPHYQSAVLLHSRPGLPPGDQSFPGGAARVSARVGRTGVHR